MTNTEEIKRPAQVELLACDALYTALVAARSCTEFVRTGADMGVQYQLHALLTVAFRGHGGASDLVMDYLDTHPHDDVIVAVDRVFEGWRP